MALTVERKQRALNILSEIKTDCERDVENREGKEITGKNMGVWLGEMSGLIMGLANVLEVLVEAQDEIDGV